MFYREKLRLKILDLALMTFFESAKNEIASFSDGAKS